MRGLTNKRTVITEGSQRNREGHRDVFPGRGRAGGCV